MLADIVEQHMEINTKKVQALINAYPPLALVQSNIGDQRKPDSLIGTNNPMTLTSNYRNSGTLIAAVCVVCVL